jgi:hypothetical protein
MVNAESIKRCLGAGRKITGVKKLAHYEGRQIRCLVRDTIPCIEGYVGVNDLLTVVEIKYSDISKYSTFVCSYRSQKIEIDLGEMV